MCYHLPAQVRQATSVPCFIPVLGHLGNLVNHFNVMFKFEPELKYKIQPRLAAASKNTLRLNLHPGAKFRLGLQCHGRRKWTKSWSRAVLDPFLTFW